MRRNNLQRAFAGIAAAGVLADGTAAIAGEIRPTTSRQTTRIAPPTMVS